VLVPFFRQFSVHSVQLSANRTRIRIVLDKSRNRTDESALLLRFLAIEFLGRRVEAQVCHAAQVNEDALANTYKTKEYVLAHGAPRHDAGTTHVYMCLGKGHFRAAVCTLSLCRGDIHGEQVAQFTRGCISVKVVHRCTHFRSPSPDQVEVPSSYG